jgi:hypothetical protein
MNKAGGTLETDRLCLCYFNEIFHTRPFFNRELNKEGLRF